MVVQNATDTLPRKSYALLHKKICDANADTGADTSEKEINHRMNAKQTERLIVSASDQ